MWNKAVNPKRFPRWQDLKKCLKEKKNYMSEDNLSLLSLFGQPVYQGS